MPQLPTHAGPLNSLEGKAETLDHTFAEVVSPNADTPYSFACADLRAEPVVLSVPTVEDRYYVMQIEDLFGHNAHYVGSRTTGSGSGSYLLAGPNWDGDAPDDIDAVLRVETDIAFIIGRTQLLGSDDVDACGQIMGQYRLQPLSEYLGGTADRRRSLPMAGLER